MPAATQLAGNVLWQCLACLIPALNVINKNIRLAVYSTRKEARAYLLL